VPSGLIDEGEEFHVLIEDTEKGYYVCVLRAGKPAST
jgi:hypothetical protein